MENQLAIFENKPIRRVEHAGEMYFAVIDIISVLIETTSPSQYWTKVKKNLIGESQLQPFWLQLKTKDLIDNPNPASRHNQLL